jgi:hypothetical protein
VQQNINKLPRVDFKNSLNSPSIKMNPKKVVKIDEKGSNKKVYFGDGGVVVDKPVVKEKTDKKKETETEEVFEQPKAKKGFKKHQQAANDIEEKWYQTYEEYNTSEFKEIKDSELNTLQSLCRSSFNDEIQKLTKSELNLLLTSRFA